MNKIKHIAIGSIIQQILSILIFIILTHHLGPTGYGMVATMLALATSIYYFGSFWVTPYLVKYGAKQVFHHGKLGDVFVIASTISLVCSMLGLLVVSILSHLKIIDNIHSYGGFLLLIMLLLGLFVLHLVRIGFQATQSFREYGYFLWLDKIAYLAIIIVFFTKGQLNSELALSSNAISMLLIAVLGLVYFSQKYLSLKVKSFLWNEFVSSSAPIFLATLTGYFCSPPFIILLAHQIGGVEQAGFVSVGFVLYGFFIQPLQWITPTLLPKWTVAIESNDQKVVRDHIDKLVLPVTLVYSLLSLTFIITLMSTPLATFILGKDFSTGISALSLIISTVTAETVHLLIISVLYATHQEKLILLATATRSVFFLTVSLLFSEPQMFFIGLLVSGWIVVAIETWAIRELVSNQIQFKILLLAGWSITFGLIILKNDSEIILVVYILAYYIWLGVMLLEYRQLFSDFIQQMTQALLLKLIPKKGNL